MITRKEINEKAALWNVSPDTVDKDWIIGHLLSAVYAHPYLKKHLVFKGGTAIRKCYEEFYRFSEDLDFSVSEKEFKLDENIVQEVLNMAEKQSGALFYLEKIRPLKSNERLMGFTASIKYWGANHPRGQQPPSPTRWTTKIKWEVTFEDIIFPPAIRPVIHPFSDAPGQDYPLRCYDIKEIMAEKFRALVQRSYTAPRDLYDIFMLSDKLNEKDWENIREAFARKMHYKNLQPSEIRDAINEHTYSTVRNAWQQSLAHQLPSAQLPSADEVIQKVVKIIQTKLFPL